MKKSFLAICFIFLSIPVILGQTFTLSRSIEIALKNDPELNQLQEELYQIELEKKKVYSGYLPELTGEAMYLKQGLPSSMEMMASQFGDGASEFGLAEDSYSLSLSVTEPLYLGGVRYYGLQASDIQIGIKKNKIELREKEVIYNVKKAFYNILIAREYIKIYQEALSLGEEQLRIARARFETGEASDFDVLRAQVQISNTKPSLYRAENNLALAKSAFLTTLNLPLNESIDISGEFNTESINRNLEELYNYAIQNRLEFKTLKLTQELAEIGIKMAKAGYYPSVIFSYSYNEKNTELETNPDTWSASWNAAFVISIPVFKGFKTRLEVEEARSRKKNIDPIIEQLTSGIKLQIKNAYLNLKSSERILESSIVNIDQARRYVEIVSKTYEQGHMTSLDMMNAQFSLTQAQVEFTRSKFDYQMNLIELEYALGK